MSGPRTKRQFAGAASDPAQRQITSFFGRASPSSADAAPRPSAQAALEGPILPGQVQTGLLTVGMRVRKAIPEGYKTGSTYSAFTLWADDNTTTTPAPATSRTPGYGSTMRELEPFCGLNKVGGLAFQPPHHNNNIPSSTPPSLTSSQETIPSSSCPSTPPHITLTNFTTTTTTTRKRIFTPDADEHPHPSAPYRGSFRLPGSMSNDCWPDDDDAEISPRSLAPPAGLLWENARVLAVPRRPKQGQSQKACSEVGGQENVMVVSEGRVGGGEDFEEAGFLVGYGERMEME